MSLFFSRLKKTYLHFQRRWTDRLRSAFGILRRAEHIFMVMSAIVIGILGALGAILFRFMIKYAQELFFGSSDFSTANLEQIPFWLIISLPVLGGLLVGPLVHFVAWEVRGSGIPEVMESVAVRGGSIRPRVAIVKSIAAAITIGSGGSAGREGPIVQIGSAIGSVFGQFLAVSARHLRTFVACGAAAGIAATFNAPIAGALFAVEIILGEYAVAQFSPIVISSVVATVISRHYIGDFPAFHVPGYQLVSAWEFIPYVLLGILSGIVAVFFIKSIYKTQDIFDNLKVPGWLKPAIGGLIVGAIAIPFRQVLGVGYESINDALWGKDLSWLLIVLLVLKIIATSATLGAGGSGGIFAPSLFIGAMLGSFVGLQAHSFYPGLMANAGAFALVGMGAMVAATTHAPITAILIIFELTNDYKIIPPLMVSAIIAVLLATWLKKESIYTMKLVRRGVNIFEGRDINILRSLYVRDVLNKDIETIRANSSFHEMIQLMVSSSHHEYFLVDNNNRLTGTFSIDEIKEFLKDENYLSGLVIAADIAHPPSAYLLPDDNLDLVMHNFGRYNVDELPVVTDNESKTFLGIVQRKDVIDAYNKEIFKADLVGGVHSVVSAVSSEREIELSEGFKLSEIDPPGNFIGKTLKETDLRSKYGVEVILIRKKGQAKGSMSNRPGAIPSPDYVIEQGDTFLVLANAAALAKFRNG
ncbi:MAG: chloride channel protein [Calditrichae bacterium]|nr:chloride channel protein [Calditrichota bacterium]MCB9059419.1 chloride channel protein [Calditrichia bacterium]